MKSLFGKKNPNVYQPDVDNTNPIPPSGGSGIKEAEVIPESVAEGANLEDVKKGYAAKTEQIAEPQWKSFNGNSCGDVTNFLNENKVDPLFMIPGANGQIRVFYKA